MCFSNVLILVTLVNHTAMTIAFHSIAYSVLCTVACQKFEASVFTPRIFTQKSISANRSLILLCGSD